MDFAEVSVVVLRIDPNVERMLENQLLIACHEESMAAETGTRQNFDRH